MEISDSIICCDFIVWTFLESVFGAMKCLDLLN